MVDNDLTPEALATMALKFSQSEYGEWLLKTLNDMSTAYLRDAKKFTDRDAKCTAIDRAAGLSEVIDLIDGQLVYAQHPELFNGSQNAIDNSEATSDK